MRIIGKWWTCDDGTTRPIMEVHAAAADGKLVRELFLIDTGADQTVLSPGLLAALGLPSSPPPHGLILQAASGESPFVIVATTLEFTRDDGTTARVRGEFAAFTDPASIEQSLLGRDILDHFDLIVSRPHNEVLLLGGNHHYTVAPV